MPGFSVNKMKVPLDVLSLDKYDCRCLQKDPFREDEKYLLGCIYRKCKQPSRIPFPGNKMG